MNETPALCLTAARIAALVTCMAAIAAAQPAQPNVSNSAPAGDADAAWANVLSLSQPVPLSRHANGRAKPHEQFAAEIKQEAARSQQAAQAARDFYAAFPNHPKAAEARKIEAIAALHGVETAHAGEELTPFSIAQAYRQNGSFSASDRFDVALEMERLDLSVKARQGLAADTPQSRQSAADALRAEFGDLPALYDYYMEIARSADASTAVNLATTVSQSRVASHNAKARAQVILERAALIGRRLTLTLNQITGGVVDLAQPRGKPAVILVWRASEPEVMLNLTQKRNALAGVDLIYVALGGTTADVTGAMQFMLLAGAYCHAPAGVGSRSVIEALKLQYGELPRVCVLDRAGLVVGSGAMQELPALLANASH